MIGKRYWSIIRVNRHSLFSYLLGGVFVGQADAPLPLIGKLYHRWIIPFELSLISVFGHIDGKWRKKVGRCPYKYSSNVAT